MTKKGENIYKRKDGRWEGRYKKGRKENGQLKYGYVYGVSYSSVKERLHAYKLKYQAIVATYGDSALSYEEWGILWIAQQKNILKRSTYSAYSYKLKKYVFPFIGHIPLNQLTDQEIQQMVDTWQISNLSSGTIHVLYQIVKKSLKVALEQQKILKTPCELIRLPKKKKNRPEALSKKEQLLLETHAKSLPLYKGLPILLALDAGLRIGEIAALRWSDIDLDNRTLHIKQTYQRVPNNGITGKTILLLDTSKTESSNRVIPMSHNLHKCLSAWEKESLSVYVCSNKTTPIEPRTLTYTFHKARKTCGMNYIHFHQLRHTFATRCIESNGDIASISKMLGHTSTQTTLDIYTDSLMESRQQIIEQMEQAK